MTIITPNLKTNERNISLMSNNLETVKEKVSPYDDLDRIWLGDGYYYKPSSLLWEVIKDGIVHQLKTKNKYGRYPYYQYSPGQRGHVNQLTQDEALWLTLEFNPDLMSYV